VPRRSPTEAAPLGRPLFVLNLKAYPRAVGDRALALGESLARLSSKAGVAAAIAPFPADLGRLAQELWIPVLSQHADPFPPGAHTGFLVPEALRSAGARGSLVNHSEHPLPPSTIHRTLKELGRCQMAAVLCARDVREAGRLARWHPPYLAVEPPELIGGTVSVATAQPQVISGTVAAVRRASPGTAVLCGAGIHDRRDVTQAIELGAEGILVASAVATARQPARAIAELLAGF